MCVKNAWFLYQNAFSTTSSYASWDRSIFKNKISLRNSSVRSCKLYVGCKASRCEKLRGNIVPNLRIIKDMNVMKVVITLVSNGRVWPINQGKPISREGQQSVKMTSLFFRNDKFYPSIRGQVTLHHYLARWHVCS